MFLISMALASAVLTTQAAPRTDLAAPGVTPDDNKVICRRESLVQRSPFR